MQKNNHSYIQLFHMEIKTYKYIAKLILLPATIKLRRIECCSTITRCYIAECSDEELKDWSVLMCIKLFLSIVSVMILKI